jgi:HK97 family phage major capsid protein
MAVKELNEKRLKLADEIKTLASRQAEWTSEDESNWAKVNGDYDATAKQIEDELSKNARAAEVNDRLKSIEEFDKKSRGDRRIGFDHQQRRNADPEARIAITQEIRALALQGWLREANGFNAKKRHIEACRAVGLNLRSKRIEIRGLKSYRRNSEAWVCDGRQEMRAGLDVATSGAGIETIPEGFVNELEHALLAFGGPRNVARVIRTATGNELPWPKVTDTGNVGALLAEATTIGSTVDPTFSAMTLNAYKYSSKPILISAELLQDSAFDMASEIGAMLGERLGRIFGAHTTTGTGSSQPSGIVVGSALGKTAAATTAIVATELMDLIHSVDPAYRVNSSGWMMHDNIVLAIRKLVDLEGVFLWQPGLQAGVPDRLLAYPITVNQHMASSIAAAAKTVLFGDFSKYIIREVGSVRFYRLDELYRGTDQTGFVAFMRMDADTITSAAIKHLIQAAS